MCGSEIDQADGQEANKSIYNSIKQFVTSYNRKINKSFTPQYAVNIVMQDDKLHICRSRPCIKNNKQVKRTLQNSGGNIELGETPEKAAYRELCEETWNDLPDRIKQIYDFPILTYTQKIYFANETVIFIHKVPKKYKLYEGDIPFPETDTVGAGEIDKLQLISISDIYDSLTTGWDGDKWRRCSVWAFKKLRPLIELYAQLDV